MEKKESEDWVEVVSPARLADKPVCGEEAVVIENPITEVKAVEEKKPTYLQALLNKPGEFVTKSVVGGSIGK